ncbi:MAG: Hpt domain-containing protein [Devosia sp.]
MAIDRQALDRLREIVGGEAADLIELIDSFLEEGPLLAERLAASQQAADLAGARRAAHSLKSNARDMGATELAEICMRLEAECAAGALPGKADIDAVQSAFAAAAAELRNMLPAEGGS